MIRKSQCLTLLFYALRILIDSALPRHIKFHLTDFNRALGQWSGHWIIISVIFDDLDVSEEGQAFAIQSIGNMDTASNGSYSVYFRPKYQFRKELFDYSQTADKNAGELQFILDKLTIDDYETVFLCRGSGDFSDD